MNQETRNLLAKIQGKNYDQIKRIIKNAPSYVKDEMLRKVKTKEDYNILRTSPKYEELRDKQLAVQMYQFLDSLAYSGYTDDPFVERKLSNKDFEEFAEFYKKRNLEQVYQKSTVKTLKNKYGPEYQEVTSFFNEKDMDSNELEYLGQNRYLYRNTVIISFENSPAQVVVEWIRY